VPNTYPERRIPKKYVSLASHVMRLEDGALVNVILPVLPNSPTTTTSQPNTCHLKFQLS
jgi:hypothetical protein